MARQQGFVVELHVGSAVHIFNTVYGFIIRSLSRYVDNGLRILVTSLRGYEHHAVGSARTVDGSSRCIFEDSEAFDGF